MGDAAIAWNNLVDATTTAVSAASSIILASASLLVEAHVGNKWRDNAASTWVLASLSSSQPIDTVMLAGVSGVNPTFRLRLSSVDSTGAAGDVYDSGSVTGLPYWDVRYRMFVAMLPAALSARYIRIDISEVGVSYIEAGRWFVGQRNTFDTNMQTPWTRAAVRGSVDTIGVGGQTFVDLRLGHWRIAATFDFVTESERIDFVESISSTIILVGHLDMLWVRDIESMNWPQDSVWGYIDGEFSETQNLYIVPALYSVQFPIRQRL